MVRDAGFAWFGRHFGIYQTIITEVLERDKGFGSGVQFRFDEFWRAMQRQNSMPAVLSHALA
jgi:hypothetical protein